jgi:uncharacterized membrane protein
MNVKLILTALAATAVAALTVNAADVDVSKLPPAAAKEGVTFDKDIKPIFEKSCVKCHGAEKAKGKLRLDSLAASLKGGENGKCVVPGDSAKSGLVHSVARLDADSAMPPEDKGSPLTKEQVGLIRAWIDQGAK